MRPVRNAWFSCSTVMLIAVLALTSGCGEAERVKILDTRSQVQRIADDLYNRSSSTGFCERIMASEEEIIDAWGTPIEIDISTGGNATRIKVRSAGPDRQLNTVDDLVDWGKQEEQDYLYKAEKTATDTKSD